MSIVQINGSSVTANSTKNSGGAGLNLGSANNLANKSSGQNTDRVGTVVVNSYNTDPALSGSIFAFDNNRPISPKITISLAGSSPNTARSINSTTTVNTRQFTSSVRNKTYDFINNVFEIGYPIIQKDDLGNDYSGLNGSVVFTKGGENVTAYQHNTNVPTTPDDWGDNKGLTAAYSLNGTFNDTSPIGTYVMWYDLIFGYLTGIMARGYEPGSTHPERGWIANEVSPLALTPVYANSEEYSYLSNIDPGARIQPTIQGTISGANLVFDTVVSMENTLDGSNRWKIDTVTLASGMTLTAESLTPIEDWPSNNNDFGEKFLLPITFQEKNSNKVLIHDTDYGTYDSQSYVYRNKIEPSLTATISETNQNIPIIIYRFFNSEHECCYQNNQMADCYGHRWGCDLWEVGLDIDALPSGVTYTQDTPVTISGFDFAQVAGDPALYSSDTLTAYLQVDESGNAIGLTTGQYQPAYFWSYPEIPQFSTVHSPASIGTYFSAEIEAFAPVNNTSNKLALNTSVVRAKYEREVIGYPDLPVGGGDVFNPRFNDSGGAMVFFKSTGVNSNSSATILSTSPKNVGPEYGWIIEFVDGSIRFTFNGYYFSKSNSQLFSVVINAGNGLDDNNWHSAAWTFEEYTIKVFIDGEEKEEYILDPPENPDRYGQIGKDGNPRQFMQAVIGDAYGPASNNGQIPDRPLHGGPFTVGYRHNVDNNYFMGHVRDIEVWFVTPRSEDIGYLHSILVNPTGIIINNPNPTPPTAQGPRRPRPPRFPGTGGGYIHTGGGGVR